MWLSWHHKRYWFEEAWKYLPNSKWICKTPEDPTFLFTSASLRVLNWYIWHQTKRGWGCLCTSTSIHQYINISIHQYINVVSDNGPIINSCIDGSHLHIKLTDTVNDGLHTFFFIKKWTRRPIKLKQWEPIVFFKSNHYSINWSIDLSLTQSSNRAILQTLKQALKQRSSKQALCNLLVQLLASSIMILLHLDTLKKVWMNLGSHPF